MALQERFTNNVLMFLIQFIISRQAAKVLLTSKLIFAEISFLYVLEDFGRSARPGGSQLLPNSVALDLRHLIYQWCDFGPGPLMFSRVPTRRRFFLIVFRQHSTVQTDLLLRAYSEHGARVSLFRAAYFGCNVTVYCINGCEDALEPYNSH